MKNLLFFLLLNFSLAAATSADTLFVSDSLEIQMRTGKGNKFRIVRTLPSGTRLEILEKDSEGYTKVRTPGGTEGWVLSRYLMTNRAARERLAETEQQLAELELENGKLTTAIESLRSEKGSIDHERGKFENSSKKLSQQLEEIKRTASSALAIDSENKELKSRIVAYERQLQTLQQENKGLRDRTARDWFMVGAGVVILGIIIGLIIPRIRWRKKTSWETL